MTDIRGTPTYGSLESPEAASTAKDHTFQWQQRGAWRQLLIAAVVPVLSQCAALSIITITVFTTKTLFTSCDSRLIGLRSALLCECSKSSLRYFPLLALVISLIIAMRMVLRQRIYYELLRHGYMLDFNTVTPVKDPLFICLVVCILLGSMHLVLIYFFSASLAEFVPFAKTTLTNYFAPSAAFLGFLAGAYDTESQLLPLSKYMEEKPELARATLASMPVMSEDLVAAAVCEGLHIPKGKEACTCKESFAELVEVTGSSPESSGVLSASITSSIHSHQYEQAAKFVQEMWPAKILLDVRLQDAESRCFRSVWYFLSALVIPLSVIVAFFFLYQAVKDVQDVRDGQNSDIGSLIVELMYAGATAWLLIKLCDLMSVPFRTRRK